ncbi:MAG: transposase, partial [Alphaproteobacteria bacterium]|nr:transposase [Alphaproteobacteria bacterium]
MGDARQHRGARAQLRRRRKKSEGDQDLGRSRGRFSTKLHGLADGLGNPLRFALTAGRAGDAPVALPLLGTVEMLAVEAVLADRADDGDALLAWIASQGAVPVI